VATHAQREHLLALMDYCYLHRAQWDYPPHDHRGSADAVTFRMSEQTLHHVLSSHGRVSADCSEWVTELLRWVGCNDPNGLGYRYAGYTGSMLSHLPTYTNAKHAQVGALVVYGPGTGDHVSMVHTPDPKGGNPLLQGHGRPGMDRRHLADERLLHRSPVRLCSIAHL
jgi:hypothetical protein